METTIICNLAKIYPQPCMLRNSLAPPYKCRPTYSGTRPPKQTATLQLHATANCNATAACYSSAANKVHHYCSMQWQLSFLPLWVTENVAMFSLHYTVTAQQAKGLLVSTPTYGGQSHPPKVTPGSLTTKPWVAKWQKSERAGYFCHFRQQHKVLYYSGEYTRCHYTITPWWPMHNGKGESCQWTFSDCGL